MAAPAADRAAFGIRIRDAQLGPPGPGFEPLRLLTDRGDLTCRYLYPGAGPALGEAAEAVRQHLLGWLDRYSLSPMSRRSASGVKRRSARWHRVDG